MTPRDKALKNFKACWAADAETDGEELPIEQQLENAWKLGWEARGSVVEILTQAAHAVCTSCRLGEPLLSRPDDYYDWHQGPTFFGRCHATKIHELISKM